MRSNPTESSVRNTGILGLGTLCSRFLGFFRDILLAHLLGPASDAFLLAFRLPNFFRRILSEGSLSLAFGAALAKVTLAKGEPSAAAFARTTVRGIGIYGALAALALAVTAPLLVWLLGPGLADVLKDQSAAFLRLMAPYLPLSLFCALCFALAADRGNFRPQAWSSTVFNITVLAFGGMALVLPQSAVPWILCLAVCVAGSLQAYWGLRCLTMYVPRNVAADADSVRKERATFMRGFPGSVTGAASHQVHLLAAMILASFAGSGGVTGLYFAERLVELPIGLAGAAIGMAALPALSRIAPTTNEFTDVLADSLRLSAFCSLPAAAGLIALAHPLSDALFGHGAFSPEALEACAAILTGLACGLPAQCAARTLLAAAHILDLGKHTLRYCLAGVGALITVTAVGMAVAWYVFGMTALPPALLGVALGVAAWVHCLLLAQAVSKKLEAVTAMRKRPRLISGIPAYLAAALLMGLLLLALQVYVQNLSAIAVLCLVAVCAVLWLGGFALAKNRDALQLLSLIRTKNNT